MKTGIYILFLAFGAKILYGQSDCSDALFPHDTYQDIKTILDKNKCQSCHHTDAGQMWHYDSYKAIFNGFACNPDPVIIHGNAGESPIISLLNGEITCDISLSTAHQISSSDLTKIERWINIGAPEECILPYEKITQTLDINGCNSCHNTTQNIWQYRNMNFAAPSAYCAPKNIVAPDHPQGSSLIDVLTQNPCTASHPVANISQDHITKIRDWIAGGANLNNQSLPLDLLSFHISLKDGQPLLVWSTASEIGVDRFVIQRSLGGSGFEDVGTLQAVGSLDKTQYTFVDNEVETGNYYYRIKIIDSDGRNDFSAMKYIRLDSKVFKFDMWPNPAMSQQSLYLTWYSKNNIQPIAKMTLMNECGQFVETYPIVSGRNKITLPQLTKGIYYFRVFDFYGSSHFERLVVL